MGPPQFVFNFDRLALRWARNDRRTPAELLRALAATSTEAFNVPGAGSLAPLCHLTIHAYDIRGPLNIDTPISPDAARPVLDDITGGKHAVPAALLAGLRLEATDAAWSFGQGRQVLGPAGALMLSKSLLAMAPPACAAGWAEIAGIRAASWIRCAGCTGVKVQGLTASLRRFHTTRRR